ncbi:MAG: hypothetical protein ACYDCQ_15230 [Dehalococcoidia bacterium]
MTAAFASSLDALTPSDQSAFVAGQRDARRHRRRGFVIADLPGLSAYASDVAELGIPRVEKDRAALVEHYVADYVEGYRAIARW